MCLCALSSPIVRSERKDKANMSKTSTKYPINPTCAINIFQTSKDFLNQISSYNVQNDGTLKANIRMHHMLTYRCKETGH